MTTEPKESYFALFRDALDHVERPSVVILFADIVGSTEMKSKGEVTWLPTVGKFYDVVEEAVVKTNGRVVKYLGDGAVVSFQDDAAADAINAAILIQESLDLLRENVLQCQCAIAITTGRPVEFRASGALDYIGSTVDLAARLSGAANPNAVWADANTVSTANMARVSSKVGQATRRSVAGYRTGEESVRLKGFNDPVTYHEIIWSSGPFGVRNSVVTQIVNEDSQRISHTNNGPVRPDSNRNWAIGQVVNWNSERGQGYIRGEGETVDRFVLRHWLTSGEELPRGSRVAFRPRDALPGKKNATAVCVTEIGVPIQAQVRVIPDGREYMFVELQDANRNPNTGLIYCPKPSSTPTVGDWLTVKPLVDQTGRVAVELVS